MRSSPRVTSMRSSLVEDSTLASQSKQLQLTDEQQLQGYITQTNTNAGGNVQKSYLDDGFVFGLDGSGLERPKGKGANVVVEGDSLETTPQQVGIVSATFAGHAFFATNAIHNLLSQTDGNVELTAITSIATVITSWIAADFGSGVFHWSVDNYGNGRTPVMGNIIAAFQGHHSAPWTITYRGFCNNVWKLCIPFGVPTVAAITYVAGPENPMSEFQLHEYGFQCDWGVFLLSHHMQCLTVASLCFLNIDSLLILRDLLRHGNIIARTSQMVAHDEERCSELGEYAARSGRQHRSRATRKTSPGTVRWKLLHRVRTV